MTQHDLTIDNDTRPAVRADITAALQALGSMSKGNSRPATPYAGQPWVDDNTPSTSVWSWYVWTGSADIKIGELNTTTNNFMPFVNGSSLSAYIAALGYAPLTSPALTGNPTAPTQTAGNNSTRVATTAFVTAAVAATGGRVAQIVESFSSASDSTSNPIPFDNTIPQIGEGDEFTSVSITPTNASSTLLIEAEITLGQGLAFHTVAAIFEASNANALSLRHNYINASNAAYTVSFSHKMTSGTTSPLTFSLRYGADSGTVFVNSYQGTAVYGGGNLSGLRVIEITP